MTKTGESRGRIGSVLVKVERAHPARMRDFVIVEARSVPGHLNQSAAIRPETDDRSFFVDGNELLSIYKIPQVGSPAPARSNHKSSLGIESQGKALMGWQRLYFL